MKLIILIYVYLRLKGENIYEIVDTFIIPFNKIIFAGVEVTAVHRKKIEQQKVDRALSRKIN
ncbi:MAG: hypothetical protein PHF46_01715 [Candidatus Gracilibacteria bacterium]|nr:hypothetical protein [Candidatus Gracilibacteria bacterium]MDD3120106.1 hypothetical protein [Candidatus Gracilibacteria bacterium]MDD4530323.1 hypothetical protein [Candidatus Gracilibacteria bacterium]